MPIAQEIGKEKTRVLHCFFPCKTNELLQTCNNGLLIPLYTK